MPGDTNAGRYKAHLAILSDTISAVSLTLKRPKLITVNGIVPQQHWHVE